MTIQTIALIYISIYLYSNREVETLSSIHRGWLKGIINVYETSIGLTTISFKVVVNKCFNNILKALWNISEKDSSRFDFLEYMYSSWYYFNTIINHIFPSNDIKFFDYL